MGVSCAAHWPTFFFVLSQAVWETICAVAEERENAGKTRLPRRLVLTLDNTTKQNKGRYLSAWLTLLVRQRVFEKAHCMFLEVGHTHDRVDQFFSRIAIHLRINNAVDRQALGRAIRKSYITKEGLRPQVVHWDKVGNFSGWMKGLGLKDVDGCTQYQYFRYEQINGRTVMQVRSHCRHVAGDQWRGLRPHAAFHDVLRGIEAKFVEACQNGFLPSMQRRNPMQSRKPLSKEEREKRWNDRRKSLEKTHQFHSSLFPQESLNDCLEILELERSQDDVAWHWDESAVCDIMGTSDVEEDDYAAHASDKDDDDDKVPPWMWAGQKLPKRNQVYIKRNEDDSFSVMRVMHQCIADDPRKRPATEDKVDGSVPEGTRADDNVYGSLFYACEMYTQANNDDPITGDYNRPDYDTAVHLDSSWALEVELTGKANKKKTKIYQNDQKKLQDVVTGWKIQA